MAGKTKKHVAAPVVTPPTGMGGHMGLKSSPYCVTDAKLTSQLIVRDRMNAHYKNLSHAKSAIDTSAPKSMTISTKKRDQARREAMQNGATPRSANKQAGQSRPVSRATSDFDRQDLLDAYASFNDEDYMVYRRNETRSLEVHPPSDLTQEYGRLNDTYPRPSSARLGKTFHGSTMNNTRPGTSPRSTPRSGDLLETRKHVFTDTENKQFQPRILKTNQTSRLSQLKLYNPPIKKRSTRSPSPDGKQRTMQSAMTSQTLTSTELMNESLMSRDNNQARTPTGIPPLDISLDKDHLKWLKEQSMKTPNRTTRSQRPDLSATRNLSRLTSTIANNRTKTLSTGRVPLSPTLVKVAHEEEELKYLDFIRDVTNDVLDRGIFTDRVLKKVFNAHIEKRKHELDVDRMQEMVADLREDLNIPENDDNAEESSPEKTRAYLGKQQSSSHGHSGQRPPIPKARSQVQSASSLVDAKSNKDINENIVNDFDTLKSTNDLKGVNGAYDSFAKSFDADKLVTLDDMAEPTERSIPGPEDDTFRDIAPAVSSAVRSGTFGEGSGPSTPKEDSFSRKPSLTSTKDNTVSRQESLASLKENSVSRQASVTSTREHSISRQASLNSVKQSSVSRQSSVASTKTDDGENSDDETKNKSDGDNNDDDF